MLNLNAKNLARFALPALLAPSLALGATTYDRARVVGVSPIYESVAYEVPVEECRMERVPHRRHHQASATGPLVGAIIGGAIGNAVGHKKRNKQVGTVVGALLGGSIGADVARRNREHHGAYARYSRQQVCDVAYEVREEERLTGYDVRYEYAGETYRTRMDRDPGRYLRVRVSVSPAH